MLVALKVFCGKLIMYSSSGQSK